MNGVIGRPIRMPRAVALLVVAVGWTFGSAASAAGDVPGAAPTPLVTAAPVDVETIPAGTKIRFSLLEPVSSQKSLTGSRFSFVMLSPIALDGRTVVPEHAMGIGTLILAGHAGSQGHEGDLTLAIDTIQLPANALVTFGPERYRINGRNRKIASALLGFVPYAGLGARYIRGSEIVLPAGEPVDAVLQQPATVTHPAPGTAASATPAAVPAAAAASSPVPAAT